MSIKKELNNRLFIQREENIKHLNYDTEAAFYQAIASGNLEEVMTHRKRYAETKGYTTTDQQNGLLSKDSVQNQKFHFVILIAMISRYCVDAGLAHETAYSMSDIYIQKCDLCTSVAAIEDLKTEMIYDYVAVMRANRKKDIYSKQIVRCIDYIYNNLNKKLTVESIAVHLQTAPTYLSKLFSKEVGTSLSAYIREKRLEAAANMLKYSDYEISDISEYFQFSSQSHFTSLFQAKYGITPKKYRDANTNKSITAK